MKLKPTILLMGTLLVPAIAFAQAPPSPATPAAPSAPPANQNCATIKAGPDDNTIAPRDRNNAQGDRPLSDKLAKSDGVLCPPPDVDPQMRAPTPQGGNTPVIPPPGSPGGDPSVVPK